MSEPTGGDLPSGETDLEAQDPGHVQKAGTIAVTPNITGVVGAASSTRVAEPTAEARAFGEQFMATMREWLPPIMREAMKELGVEIVSSDEYKWLRMVRDAASDDQLDRPHLDGQPLPDDEVLAMLRAETVFNHEVYGRGDGYV